MPSDEMWRALVNSIPIDLEGEAAPEQEAIEVKKRGRKRQPRFTVQKIITEVIVSTDLNGKSYSAPVFQQLVLYGELTEGKLNRLIANEIAEHEIDEG